MFGIVKTILSDVLGSNSMAMWDRNDGLRMFFQSEYKKDARWAYEYWISNGTLDYHTR